jgi:hypothetical protein
MEYHRSSSRTVLKSLTATVCYQGWRIFHRVISGVETLFEGFWLGLLPDSVIDLVSERSYGEGAEYTGPSYLDAGFHFWEEIAVRRFFPGGGKVLVAAAGGGREVIALARAGFVSAGFECSHSMVSAGQRALAERGLDNRLEWAPPCQLPENMLRGEFALYDAAIVGWNGYTYISPRRRRIAFLRDLRVHLAPDSPVLVSGAIRGMNSGVAVWTPRVANAVRMLTFRRPEFGTGAGFPGRPRHKFSRSELEAELVEAGFSPLAFWKWGPFGAAVARSTSDDVKA